MFLVPERRRDSIWREIAVECRSAYSPTVDKSIFHVQFDTGTFMLVCTWTEILDTLEKAIPRSSSNGLQGDLQQLRALCDQQGGGAFKPFQDGEFESRMAERMIDLHDLVDKTIKGLPDLEPAWTVKSSLVGLSNMNYRFFASLYGCKAGIGIRYRWWAKHGYSPFWVRLYITDYQTQAEAMDALMWEKPLLEGGDSGRTHVLVPLDMPTGADWSSVLGSVFRQLQTLANRLRPVLNPDG